MNRVYEKYFAHQLGKPTGLFGRFYMKRFLNEGNQRSNELALKHLEIGPSDRILEIGFGGGWLLRQMSGIARQGKVSGVDHANTMVKLVHRETRALPHPPTLVHGDAEALPFESKSFTHVVAVHNLYFWKRPAQALREIFRVLQPGGRVVLGIHSKAKLETQPLTRHGFTLYEPQAVLDLLARASFENIRLHSYDPDEWEDNHCIVAQRPLETK